MNEAEFQTEVTRRIREAFPLLPADFQLEHYLRLQLGHHKIVIDGKNANEGETKGRFDILVKHQGAPLLMIELKAPGVSITAQDELQSLSYARLHTPIVPIYMVTNGATTICKRTYDRTEINLSEEGATLEKILKSANKIAAIDAEDAIRTLLSVSKDTWIPLLEEWSNEEIASLSGSIRDLDKPLTESFSIPRELSKTISNSETKSKEITVIHGRPYSGITNTLVQIFQLTKNKLSVYIDSRRHTDILQALANRLSRKLSFGVTKDDVRKWINSNQGLCGIIFICDGIPDEGLNELIDYSRSSLCGIVLGIDSESYRNITYDGRVSRYNLRLAPNHVFEQEKLSAVEYNLAAKILDEEFSAKLMHGDAFVPELKWPKLLRHFAATLPENVSLKKSDESEQKIVMPAILHHSFLKSMSSTLVKSHQIKYDLQRFAKAYLKLFSTVDAASDIGRKALSGIYALLPEYLENEIGESRIERLCSTGFITWSEDSSLGPILVIRNEEVLSYFISLEWQKDLQVLTNRELVDSGMPKILKVCSFTPMSEIALAHAIVAISRVAPEATSIISNYLINSRPTKTILPVEAEIDIVSLSIPMTLQLDEDINRTVRGNLVPWLTMSYLLVEEMAPDDDGFPRNFDVIAIIGQYDDFLWQPRPSDIDDMPQFIFHDLPNGKSIPCYHMGIVEPLQQALCTIACRYPQKFQSFAKWALENGNAHIKWRILSVAMTLLSSATEEIARSAEIIVGNLRGEFIDCNES